jgi:large subunit ribosomal protein LP0
MESNLKKSLYFEKLAYLFSKYSKIIIIKADNVGSNQIQNCRKMLEKNSILVMGKNTIIKKVLRKEIEKNPKLEELYDYTVGNIGLIFTKAEILEVKKILKENKIPAPAKAGQIAQCEVTIPAGPTEIPPEGTSFFQALNIPTKINKGQIEIQDPIKLIEKGKIVGDSEAALLKKLNIIPFSFELEIQLIFEAGVCYKPEILDISSDKIIRNMDQKFSELNYLSVSIYYPTVFSIKNTTKKVIAELLALKELISS